MRAYFNINLYGPFLIISQKLDSLKDNANKFFKNKEIEMVKRKHTLDLKRKIDEKTKEEAEIEKSNINEVRQLENDVIEPQKDYIGKKVISWKSNSK